MDGDDNVPSSRSGLRDLYGEGMDTSRLLVVSRVSNQKVLPWIVSSTGAVRCFDTVSLSQKLSLHRHAKVPIFVHVFLWDRSLVSTSVNQARIRASAPPPRPPPVLPLPHEVQLARQPSDNQILPLPPEAHDGGEAVSSRQEPRLDRDTAGELSFRFHDFALSSNWV